MRETLLSILIALTSPTAFGLVCNTDHQQSELSERLAADQNAREAVADGNSDRADFRHVLGVDANNRMWLEHLLLTCQQWPRADDVGNQAAKGAWMIALHADMDPAFQEMAARHMREAVLAGEAKPRRYAGLVDRARRNQGEEQEFGTDFEAGDDTVEFHPIRDPGSVDERRQAIGLPPLCNELCRVDVTPGVVPNGADVDTTDCGRC